MPPLVANTVLVLLPLAVCLTAWRSDSLGQRLRALLPDSTRGGGTKIAFTATLLIPVALLLLATGAAPVKAAASVFTTIAALLGGYLLRGFAGLAASATLCLLVWAGRDSIGIAYDTLALLCAIAAGALLVLLLQGRRRLLFLGALCAVDLVVVSFSLTDAALFPAALSESFPAAGLPPVFLGVVVSGYFLGGIDLACAWLVGRSLKEHRLWLLPAFLTYAFVQTALALSVTAGLALALPAVLAPTAALLAGHTPRRRSAVALPARPVSDS